MILLTGATGYIGSHTWLALHERGHRVVGLDNFSNSSPAVLDRLASLGVDVDAFVEADVSDGNALDRAFARWDIEATVHFAALKAVGQSVKQPVDYWSNNVGGLLSLVAAMRRAGSSTLVFSSSATVYGDPVSLPIVESAPLRTTSPYGSTKLAGETILSELCRAEPSWNVAILRYFNPVGAHRSGMLGEDPHGLPNNLMPFVAQVAVGRRSALQVFGADYPTPDGTGVRDYIHIEDVAEGHVAALKALREEGRCLTVNLGTGRGYSVLEVVSAFERASKRRIPIVMAPRRDGDVAACWADPALARSTLRWQAQRDLDRMCEDTWRWQSMNPDGYVVTPALKRAA